MIETGTSAVRAHETRAAAEGTTTPVHAQRIQDFIDQVNDVLLDNTIVLEEHELTIEAAKQHVGKLA